MMTDEERQKLCDELRNLNPWRSRPIVTDRAANEIERLAEENEGLKKTQLKFRIQEPQPFIIRDD